MITVLNVVNASPVELLCLTYELFLEKLEEARVSEGEKRQESLAKAREVLVSLSENLDLSIELAQDLFRLYVYIQGLLTKGKDDDEAIREASKLIDCIYQGYRSIANHKGDKKPVMDHTQDVYAGMTYGKGYLHEVTLDNEERGYKA